jgi:putative ABC transport system substrate-binding protein
MHRAAQALGLRLEVVRASAEHEFDRVFASLSELRAGGLVISPDSLLVSRGAHLAELALRHSMPAVSQFRQFTAAGGLMSYSGSLTDLYRLVGHYTGRILKGDKPAELPVQQATKVEVIINLKTASDHAARPRR